MLESTDLKIEDINFITENMKTTFQPHHDFADLLKQIATIIVSSDKDSDKVIKIEDLLLTC